MIGLCKECDSVVDVKRSPDGPDFCPECRTVDNIDFDFKSCTICFEPVNRRFKGFWVHRDCYECGYADYKRAQARGK